MEIVDWQAKGKYCIFAKATWQDGETFNICTTAEGEAYEGEETAYDLFFADDEVDEFELAMTEFAHAKFDKVLDISKNFNMKEWKTKLLEIARKQLEPEFKAEIEKAYKNADNVQFERGRQSVLYSLPVLKKHKGADVDGIYFIRNRNNQDFLVVNGWCVSIDELFEKLPKETEE